MLISGGGTGGHVYPALAVVNELRKRGLENHDLLWIGTHGQMEETLVPRAGLSLETISGGQIAGVARHKQVANALRLIKGTWEAWKIICRFKPNVLLMTGGYVNAPVGVAAKLCNVPAAIYLPDVEPGSAIKQIAPLVQKIACTTDDSSAYLPAKKLVVTGYPVRASLRKALHSSPENARTAFGLDKERPTLFVFGGSRGAQTINKALMAILPDLLQTVQLIHCSGTLTWDEVQLFATTLPEEIRRFYKPFPYLHEKMGMAFRAADLVVARAGASMLGECPAFGVPAILVPYPHAWRYQKVNADFLVRHNAGIRLDDEMMAEQLLPTIMSIIADSTKLATMKNAAAKLDIVDAPARITDVLETIAQG